VRRNPTFAVLNPYSWVVARQNARFAWLLPIADLTQPTSYNNFMGLIRFTLCKTKGIGLIMWLTFLCHFPPLIEPTEVSLKNTGLILNKEFEVPVETAYVLYFRFAYPSSKEREMDKVLGDRFSRYCFGETEYTSIPENQREGHGLPVPLKVLIYKKSDNTLILEKIFHSLCVSSHGNYERSRQIGKIKLKYGDYRIEVFNLFPQHAFKDINASIFLVSSGNGK
jgi:Domain of unknown function (DUF5625)